MRIRTASALPSYLLLLASYLSLSAAASSQLITLSDFQQIAGFSESCTIAYNTPIPGCTSSDFSNNDPCSQACINGLETITALLNSACLGTEAQNTTLIGLFFKGEGVNTLCPNAADLPPAQATSTGVEGGSAGTTTVANSPSTSAAIVLSISTTSHTLRASSTTKSTTSFPSASAVSALSSPTSTSSSTAAAGMSTTTTQAGSGLTKTIINDGTATVVTSKSEQTASTNPDAFGGGGSPFEISGGAHMSVGMVWLVLQGMFIWMIMS